VKLELLYRASRDGWQGQDFHSRCDNKGATVTFIESTGGFVFGGYADVSWKAGNGGRKSYTHATQAFFFSLHRPSGVGPVKLPLVQNHQHAIYNAASHGPTFGVGDLYVPNCAVAATATLAATLISDTRTSCRRASQHRPFSRARTISRQLRWRCIRCSCSEDCMSLLLSNSRTSWIT
jgi:hypothetical protein